MKKNIVAVKSVEFAILIVETYKHLADIKKEYVMSKQLLRSGTAIGAMLREARFAESKKDFLHKTSIALKECNETDYWLMLLSRSNYLEYSKYQPLDEACKELIRLLASIVKTTKTNL